MSRIGLQIPNFTFDAPDSEIFDKVAEMAVAAEDTGSEVGVEYFIFNMPLSTVEHVRRAGELLADI
jgi:hypothetical protein